MRGLFARCLIVGLIGGLSMAGCARRDQRPDDFEKIPGVVTAPDGLKFSVRVTPARFVPGDRVLLEASLFNGSEDSYRKRFDSSCVWDYEITTEDGMPLTAERACVPQDSVLFLEPGELRMIVREWSGRDRYFNAAQPLAAGRYLVVAGFLDQSRHVIPMSLPAEIEVLPPRGGR